MKQKGVVLCKAKNASGSFTAKDVTKNNYAKLTMRS